jgi:23S rRNA (guanosine2251-2'-O)-methyltransferase
VALQLRNPHSVLAALQTRPKDVTEVRLHSAKPPRAWEAVAEAAHQHGVAVRRGARRPEGGRRSAKNAANEATRAGGGEATVKELPGVSLKELFPDLTNDPNRTGLWLALDCLQDPHNVGAVFRSAAFFGIEGIVVSKDRSAPLNATVFDVASGGMEYIPFSVQTNLSRALNQAKDRGLWVLGASEHAEQDISQVDRQRPWLLVVGNEEKGLRRLTKEQCDTVCRLSPRGRVGSLNVSVATGVLMTWLTSANLPQS